MNRIIILLMLLIGSNCLAQKPKTIKVGGSKFKMIYIAGNTFEMGFNYGDFDSKPHSVTLSSYYIGETVVSQKLWVAVMGDNPSDEPKSPDTSEKYPVTNVTYDMAQDFITKLNQKTGLQFRLPTEAEWEYAAKSAGIGTVGKTVNRQFWLNNSLPLLKQRKKTDKPNGYGIWYMLGNVWEWCSDYYGANPSGAVTNPQGPSTGIEHVIRGGGYLSETVGQTYRCSFFGASPEIGLRLAMSYENVKK